MFSASPIAVCEQALANPEPTATEVIFVSDDGGASWQDISAGLPADAAPGPLYADAISGQVFVGTGKGLFHSIPAPSTNGWQRETMLPCHADGIYPSRKGLLVWEHRNGFYQNWTGTDVWVAKHQALPDPSVRDVVETADGSLVVCTDSGIFKTSDGGKSWRKVFEDELISQLDVAPDGTLSATVYQGILRSTDGGEHWNWVTEKMPTYRVVSHLDGQLVAFAKHEGKWQAQTLSGPEQGKNWQPLADGLATFRAVFDLKQVGDVLLCTNELGVSRSTDGGKTWQLVRQVPNESTSFRLTVAGKLVYLVKSFGC